jgi:hypothetical protein
MPDELDQVAEALAASPRNGDHGAAREGGVRRGSPEAAREVAKRLGWDALLDGAGVQLERVTASGYEPDSTILLHLSTGRRIAIDGTNVLLSRIRFQAAVSAALMYACPSLTQDALHKVAGHILGLAEVEDFHATPDAAHDWGVAYTLAAGRIPYDDAAPLTEQFKVLDALRREAADNRDLDRPPPNKALHRAGDGALLVVRSWFHHVVRHDFEDGEHGLSAQRISALMWQVGWERMPNRRSAVQAAVRVDGRVVTRQLRVYVVPAKWGGVDADS